MKSMTEYLTFTIRQRMGFLNITTQVDDILRRSGIQEGLCLVNAMHITASVFINDDEPGLHEDYKKWLVDTKRIQNGQPHDNMTNRALFYAWLEKRDASKTKTVTSDERS